MAVALRGYRAARTGRCHPAGMPQPGEGRLAVDVAIRFVEALDADAGATGADPDLRAERLAPAAAAALPVDGVGLSLHGEAGRRTPLAASSEGAAPPSGCSSPPAAGHAPRPATS